MLLTLLLIVFISAFPVSADIACKDKLKDFEYDSDIPSYLTLLPECKNNQKIRYNLALLYYQQKEYELATDYLKNDFSLNAKLLLGKIKLQRNETEFARKYLREAETIDSENTDVLLNLAWLAIKEKQFSQAREILLKIPSQTFLSEYYLAYLELEMDQNQVANSRLHSMLDNWGGREDLLRLLLYSEAKLSRYDNILKAKKLYPEFFKKYPEWGRILH